MPEGTAVLGVLLFGFIETYGAAEIDSRGPLVLATALAVALYRRAPAAGLAVLWAVCLLHAGFGTAVLVVEVAFGVVFYGTARWGRPVTAALGGLSVPVTVLLAFSLYQSNSLRTDGLGQLILTQVYQSPELIRLAFSIAVLVVAVGPWPAGLVLRFQARAAASHVSQIAAEAAAAGARRETEQAREIARLRDAQTRLARDVHDVVGHSLAVILAQSESAQYLDDPDSLKRTMETIATSARSSLRDVRAVLSSTQEQASVAGANTGGFDSLVDGVRRSGYEVVAEEVGAPVPLPPEIELAAYRTLQEMLTNAIRHGRRDQPIHVERHWPTAGTAGAFADTVRFEVSNMTHGGGAPTTDGGGRGLDGMRRRLESVGGHLDVRVRDQPAGTTFTATAWLPVRDNRSG